MGRGRKFSKLAIHENERDARMRSVDDGESSPMDDDAEPSSMDNDEDMRGGIQDGEEERGGIQWATMQDPEGDDTRETKEEDGSAIRVDSTERSSCRTERDHPEMVPQLAGNPVMPRPTRRCDGAREHCGEGQLWQELAAEAAGAEIEAMHWDQAGSPGAAIEGYRQVAMKLLQAADSLEKEHAVRQLLEQRATEALERVAALEASQGALGIVARDDSLHRDQKAKLTTQGILASTLATTASSGQPDDPTCKSLLLRDEAKILGTAAMIGGAAGMLLMGPVSAASLGGMAAYATTREDAAGAAARKLCTTSIGMADQAVNKAVGTGLKAADFTLEEGRRRLLEGLDGSPNTGDFIKDWCSANKDKCIRAVAAVESLQGTLPRRKLSEEARRMKTRYPDRVPVLCERGPGARSDLPDIERNKFAVPEGMLFGEFKYIVHKQVTQASRGLAVEETLYLFVGEPGVQPKTSATMAELYKLHGAEDGFLYVRYTAENTLGERCLCT